MAEWKTPKTNWPVEDVPGVGDFNRIEGNTEYLKGQTDGLKNGSIKAGDAVKLSGQSPSYYAKQADIDGLKSGSIKAGDASKINGQSPGFAIGSVTVPGNSTIVVVHNLNKTRIYVSHTEPGVTTWARIDANRVRFSNSAASDRNIRYLVVGLD